MILYKSNMTKLVIFFRQTSSYANLYTEKKRKALMYYFAFLLSPPFPSQASVRSQVASQLLCNFPQTTKDTSCRYIPGYSSSSNTEIGTLQKSNMFIVQFCSSNNINRTVGCVEHCSLYIWSNKIVVLLSIIILT